MRRLLLVLIVLVAGTLGLVQLGYVDLGPVVITQPDEQKLILLLSDPRDEATTPGVSARIPLLEEPMTFDARWLYLDSEIVTIQTKERVPLEVDNYVIWRIADPLQYFKSFSAGVAKAEDRIDREVNARVREIVGTKTLDEVVTTQRDAIMDEITRQSREKLAPFGIEVNDVRIVSTDLPRGPLENVYSRMRSERERLAREYRAKGDQRAREIRAEADKQARIRVAQAREQAEKTRGEGDARSTKIYADAYNANPEFYRFTRSLEAYRNTLGEGDTLVLPPDHEFLQIFQAGGNGQRPR